jgi:hypothetical protein
MDKQNQSQPEQDPKAPAKLVTDLKELHKEHIFVPPKVDQSILNAAREQLEETSREPAEQETARQPWIPQWAPWAAAAASLMLLLFLTLPGEKHTPPSALAKASVSAEEVALKQKPSSPATVISRKDINKDGQVDILDAFTLASRIKAGAAIEENWDINGDGQVNQADVEEISAFAVKLGPEDKS